MGFGLDSSLFARCYSGNPVWFLFLPLLRCFRSGGSRSLPGAPRLRRTVVGSPIQESPVLKLHTLTRGPIAAGRALPRRSSRAIPQTAWHVGLKRCLFDFGCEPFSAVLGPMHGFIMSLMSSLTSSLHVNLTGAAPSL